MTSPYDRPADVAVPNRRGEDPALVEHVPHPGGEATLGCPNCLSSSDLVLIERITVERPVEEFFDVGTTAPEWDGMGEVDFDEFDYAPAVEPSSEILGVRCDSCRWGYQGPGPLSKLVRL